MDPTSRPPTFRMIYTNNNQIQVQTLQGTAIAAGPANMPLCFNFGESDFMAVPSGLGINNTGMIYRTSPVLFYEQRAL